MSAQPDQGEGITEEFADDLADLRETVAADETEAGEERQLVFANVEQWVQQWLLPHYRRNPKVRRWDPQWWRYEEVSTLLEGLWQSWEYFRHEGPTGMIVFFRDYLWPVMDVITSDEGPLWAFDPVRNDQVPPKWEVTDAPTGLFVEE